MIKYSSGERHCWSGSLELSATELFSTKLEKYYLAQQMSVWEQEMDPVTFFLLPPAEATRGFRIQLGSCYLPPNDTWRSWNDFHSMPAILLQDNPMLPMIHVPQPNSIVSIASWRGRTPTAGIPVLSQNEYNSNCSARFRKRWLSSLIVWLVEDRSLTNFLCEKLTVRTLLRVFAKSAPRWGVPRKAIPMTLFPMWSYLCPKLCALIKA